MEHAAEEHPTELACAACGARWVENLVIGEALDASCPACGTVLRVRLREETAAEAAAREAFQRATGG